MMMKRYVSRSFLAISILVVASCGVGANFDASTGQSANDRIIGGTTFADLPAVGCLAYYGECYCTATLISARKAVTAGHCTQDIPAAQTRFLIGATQSSPQYSLRVASLQAHPQFTQSSTAINNDIGLVTLAQDAPVAPLPVIATMDSSFVGKSLFFVGYGVNDGASQSGAGIKRAVWMKIKQVAGQQFAYSDPGVNTCNGDSGGPAFYRDGAGKYYIAGVTSYGDQYCTQYGVDTRVDPYLSFLGVSGSTPGAGGTSITGATTDTSAASSTTPTSSTPAAAPQTDNCHGETYAGRCNGTHVVYCQDNQLFDKDCAKDGMTCKFDAVNQYNACG
jgi:secreted trypsin-like serine protease